MHSMSARAFVDTNVLVYAYDQRGGEKTAIARELLKQLWSERRGVLSTQVLQEFALNVRRKFTQPMTVDQVRQAISLYRQWRVLVNSVESILGALEIEQTHQLSFWDALIVQAAIAAGCEILYSEDLSHGQEYEGVRVMNPFKEGSR